MCLQATHQIVVVLRPKWGFVSAIAITTTPLISTGAVWSRLGRIYTERIALSGSSSDSVVDSFLTIHGISSNDEAARLVSNEETAPSRHLSHGEVDLALAITKESIKPRFIRVPR